MQWFEKTRKDGTSSKSGPAGEALCSEEDLRACFRLLLGREPSQDEWNWHRHQVGQEIASVVQAFLDSSEFKARGLGMPSANMTKPSDGNLLEVMTASADIALGLDPPVGVDADAPWIDDVLDGIRKIYGQGAETDYFKCSLSRYRLYFALARALPNGARILDIGSAPGHVSIGLHLMGFNVEGINLNEEWNKFYPSPEWIDRLGVKIHDCEKAPLPWEDESFDAVFFCEVLEHIAVKNPAEILADIRRALKGNGMLLLSTPNVCNISNIYALLKGRNVMWDSKMFYGSYDRHNREYTPDEVLTVLEEAGFSKPRIFGWNCDSNWRSGAGEWPYHIIAKMGDRHPLLRNTIVALARKDRQE
jgi:2-polyprenyl-3-methyl-5-hydroxy-6-metoxy-1,4-benzoquinol methylase